MELLKNLDFFNEERINRMIITERVDEDRLVNIGISKSNIVSSDGGEGTINVSIDDKEVKEAFHDRLQGIANNIFKDVPKTRKISLRVKMIEAENENYVINKHILFLDRVTLKDENGKYPLGPEATAEFANMFGLAQSPLMQVPVSMLKAVQEKDEEALETICEKIRNYVSMYGSYDFEPKFEILLGSPKNEKEAKLRWSI